MQARCTEEISFTIAVGVPEEDLAAFGSLPVERAFGCILAIPEELGVNGVGTEGNPVDAHFDKQFGQGPGVAGNVIEHCGVDVNVVGLFEVFGVVETAYEFFVADEFGRHVEIVGADFDLSGADEFHEFFDLLLRVAIDVVFHQACDFDDPSIATFVGPVCGFFAIFKSGRLLTIILTPLAKL